MNDHLTPLRAAYVAQMQRTFRQNTRGIPTPEQRRAWADDANALIAAHDHATAARAWDEGFEEPRECCGLCPLRSCPWDNGGNGPTNPYREGDST